MLYFKEGSHLHELITLLCVAGEFPYKALYLLGKERVLQMLVNRLTKSEAIKDVGSGEIFCGRVLNVSGTGSEKTIRLYKGAFPILEWVHSQAHACYMRASWHHKFPGDMAHRERNHRVAEAVAVCMKAGLECRPFFLPILQTQKRSRMHYPDPVFYPARSLKNTGQYEMSKTAFTRLVGAVFCESHCFAVYNTRASVMKWSGMGEFKALHSLTQIARLNACINEVEGAVLFAYSGDVALSTLSDSDNGRTPQDRFDKIYRHVYFVPMDINGISLLKILCVRDFKEKILDCLFESDTRSYNRGIFEYDACIDHKYILSHLDGDLARLIRFREAMSLKDERIEIICYPFQVSYLRAYLGEGYVLKTIPVEEIVKVLGL